MQVREFASSDTAAVVALWQECGLTRPWNNPELDIQRKLKVGPELFLVGVNDNVIVATLMGGYDGHRAWVNYLAVAPVQQGTGLGRHIMEEFESRVLAAGCPKINLQIRTDNQAVIDFYKAIGYSPDDCMSMGKRLVPDS